MKINIIALSVLLALTGACANAQSAGTATITSGGTTFGLRAGVNMQNINGKDAINNKLENKLIIGYNAGVNAEIPIANDYYLQPGILFSTKGAKLNNNYGTIKLSYLEVPVNFVYKPMFGTSRILIGFGPYVGFAVGGRYKPNTGSNQKVTFKNTVSVTDPAGVYIKRFDAGANFLAGYELSSRISAQLNAQLGLLKTNPKYSATPNDKSAWKNTGFGISVGYRF